MSSLAESPVDTDFARAFLCVQYLLGRRGKDLTLRAKALGEQAARLAQRLNHPDQVRRAKALAPELARLLRSLDDRRLG